MKPIAFCFFLLIAAAQVRAAEPPAVSATATNQVVADTMELTPALVNQWSEELRAGHPALKAAAARTNSAVAAVAAVRTWEDPKAIIGGVVAREEMQADEGNLLYGVEQKLPLFGKPQLARKAAQAEAAVESANLDYEFQRLRRDLAQLAFQTALASEVVGIGQEDLSWLDAMVQTMDSRYRAGQATLVEVLSLQNERARRITLLETDRQKLGHEHVSLNRMLNRPLDSPWPVLRLPEPARELRYSQKLADIALRYEPRLEVMRRQVARAEASLASTRRQRWPDLSLGAEGRNYTGDGSFRQGMFTLSMNLPWVNSGKYRQDIQRDEAKVRAAEFDRADLELAIREEIHGLVVQIDAARREAILYQNEIQPRSRSALESARAGWESGRNIFRDVVEARRMLLEAGLMHARAVSEQYRMLSDLVLCCGVGDLEALQMIGVVR